MHAEETMPRLPLDTGQPERCTRKQAVRLFQNTRHGICAKIMTMHGSARLTKITQADRYFAARSPVSVAGRFPSFYRCFYVQRLILIINRPFFSAASCIYEAANTSFGSSLHMYGARRAAGGCSRVMGHVVKTARSPLSHVAQYFRRGCCSSFCL